MAAPSGPEQVLFKGFVSCSQAARPQSSQMEGESLVSGWWLIKLSLLFLSSDKADCRNRDKILTPLVHPTLLFKEEETEMLVSILCLYFPICVYLNTRHDVGSHSCEFIYVPNCCYTYTKFTFTHWQKSAEYCKNFFFFFLGLAQIKMFRFGSALMFKSLGSTEED